MKCIITGCDSSITTPLLQGGVSSHRFPSSETELQQWITAIRIFTGQEVQSVANQRICGNHFRPDEFCVIGTKFCLKKGSIPSVFAKTRPCETEQLEILLDDDPDHYVPVLKKAKVVKRNEIEKPNSSTAKSGSHAPDVGRVKRKYKHKVRMLQQKCRRLQHQLTSMEDIFTQTRDKNMLSQSAADHLRAAYSESDTLIHALQTYRKGRPFSEQLRSFATTLHFYSPRAYQFVRQAFRNRLPHPRTIIRWYRSVEGEPGLTAETMAALEVKANEYKASGKRLLVALMMDEVAIRRHTEWNDIKKCFEGVVQYSGFLPENSDELPVAKEALVFMATGISENWKIPIGYFLSDSLDTEQKVSLIENILMYLDSINVTVISFTFDGTSTNFSTANRLGACLKNGPDLKTFFPHPVTNDPVFIILDPCHMLKLVRNTLAAKAVFNTTAGHIKWEFIEDPTNINAE